VNTLSQKLVWLVILLLQVTFVYAQQHNFTQYTIEDGLPTNYVYGVVEDDCGYIWAYTEQGIARFDGYEWKAFGLNDGLETLDCYSMCPLEDGSFLVGGKGWPTIVDGDSLYKLPIPKGIEFKKSYFENSTLREGYPPWVKYNIGPHITKRKNLLVYSSDSFMVYDVPANKDIFMGSDTRIFSSKANQREIERKLGLDYMDLSSNDFFIGEVNNVKLGFWRSPFNYVRNGKLIGEPEGVKYKSFRGLVSNRHLQLYVDSVLYVFDSLAIKINSKIDLTPWYEKYDVNRVVQMANGDIWIATRSKGLLHVSTRSRRVKIISDSKGEFVSFEGVASMGGEIYAADDKSNLFRLHGDHLLSLNLDRISREDSRFRFLRKLHQDQLVFERGRKSIKVTSKESRELDHFFGISEQELTEYVLREFGWEKRDLLRYRPFAAVLDFVTCKGFVLIEDINYIYRYTDKGDWKVLRNSSDYIFEKGVVDHKSEIFVGEGPRLFQWSASKIDTIWESDSLIITALYEIDNETLLIGTQSNGIYHLTLGSNPQLVRLISTKFVKTITKDYDSGTYWAATYSGVYRFSSTGEVDLHLTKLNGLPSSETYDLAFFSDSVAVGTAKGLAVFDQNITAHYGAKIQDRHVEIKNLIVEGETVEYDGSKVVLRPGENDFEVNFSLLHPSSNGEVRYEVELQPYSREALVQKSRYVRYSQLAPGNYEFFVNATASDGSKYSLQEPVKVIVRAYLYKRLWFQLLCLGLIGGGGWMLYRSRLKEKFRLASERLKNDRRISELQLEALRSQMNPHFVFNALGSIQYYIQSEEKELADSYLTKFAQLMRKYLDSSKKNLVTVGEELDLLTQYMELEKMRFDHAFAYRFNIDDDVDESDHLPSMILQPFVENAIIHGIANRKSAGGEIEISISIVNDETVVVISDNGIGIEHSNKLKRRGHRSRATEITNQRIQALQNSGNAHIDLVYDVPCPENIDHPGTRATLRINYHKNEN